MILNGGVLPNIYATLLGKRGEADADDPTVNPPDDEGEMDDPFISEAMHQLEIGGDEDFGDMQSVEAIAAHANLHPHLNFEFGPAMSVKMTLNEISKAATTSELLASIVLLRDAAVTSDEQGGAGGRGGVDRDSVLSVVKAKKKECPELWTTEIAGVFGEMLRTLPKQQGGGQVEGTLVGKKQEGGGGAGGGEGKDGGAGRGAIPLETAGFEVVMAFPTHDLLRLCATAGITRVSRLIFEEMRGKAMASLEREVHSAILSAMARCGDGPLTIRATDLVSAINIFGGGGAAASVAAKVDLSQRRGRAAAVPGEFDWSAACEKIRPYEEGGGGDDEKVDDQAAGRKGGERGDGGGGGGWEVESADADSAGEEERDDDAYHYWRDDPDEQRYPDRVGARTAALVAVRMCQKQTSVLFPFLPFSRLLLTIANDIMGRKSIFCGSYCTYDFSLLQSPGLAQDVITVRQKRRVDRQE